MPTPEIKFVQGNSLDILADTPAESVDLIVTDPPYKIVTGGDSGDRPKGILAGNRNLFTHQTDIEIHEWMPLLFKVLKQQSHAYIFTNSTNLHEMLDESLKAGFLFHNLLVWEKNNCTPSQFYMKNCEYVLFLRKGQAKYINNIGNSKTVHYFSNIIGTKSHPCEKPVELLKYYITNSSQEGELVLDPFMGTGSCAVACTETKRNFLGIELDPHFFSVAKQRIDNTCTFPPEQGFLPL